MRTAGSSPREPPPSLGEGVADASTIRFTLPSTISPTELPPTFVPATTGAGDGKVEAKARSPLPLVEALAVWARERGVDLPDLEVSRPTLEDIYLELTEKPR